MRPLGWDRWRPYRHHLHPQSAELGLYDELYPRVYRPPYTQLQPLYQEMRRLTGYPR